MSPTFGSLSAREVIRALLKAGYYVHEVSGSHAQLKHPQKPGRITVPCHTRFDLPKHVVKSIIRQAGLSNNEFVELLRD